MWHTYVHTISAVIQACGGSYQNVAIAHLCHVQHFAHVTRRYYALLLKMAVEDNDTSVKTTTPELLVDDSQTSSAWNFLFCLFHPLLFAQVA